MIGTEWDQNQQKESYWLCYQGRCRLVPDENHREATLEESLSREKVVEEIKSSLTSLAEEKKPFTFDDDRKGAPPGPRPSTHSETQQEPPDTPVFLRTPCRTMKRLRSSWKERLHRPIMEIHRGPLHYPT